MPDSSDPAETTSRPKYHAAITYVPEEFIWCDWLHRQLDGTAVPADLANKRTRHGFSRPPVLNVFPDPRNPTHLARQATTPPPSRHLIVICSPHSAGSAAIEEQIRAFKSAEGEDRIVVLVTDGDPDHDDAPAGADDATWLPAWIRWRLDKKGNFRPAEASEPQIIDARADRLDPQEARAHLLAALLDVPRDSLRAYGDLVSASASATLQPVTAGVEPEVAAPAPKSRGFAGFIVIGLIVAAAAGAYWVSTRPPLEGSATPVAATPVVAVSTPTPRPSVAPKATPKPTARPATPTPKPPSSPTPKPPVTTPKGIPLAPVASAKKATPVPATVPKKTTARFATSEGPQSAVTSITAPGNTQTRMEPGSSWQRMRDLGDELLSRDNRNTGLIALTQAVEVALRDANRSDTSLEERIDIARLCFRVGALQKQFVSPEEARRTLNGGRSVLLNLQAAGEQATERDSLISDIDQLLRSIPR